MNARLLTYFPGTFTVDSLDDGIDNVVPGSESEIIMGYLEHNCPSVQQFDGEIIVVATRSNRWYAGHERYGVLPVLYCPYCGEKLERKEQP